MLNPELLIFDCDGVLIDSEPLASRLLARALHRAGVEISVVETFRRFTGVSESDAGRICAQEFGLADTRAIFAEMNAELYDEFHRSLRPMPGIPSLVKALPHRKCVGSNSTMERLRRSLGLFDLWAEFDPNIFSAEMVARPKPAPDLFLYSARVFGVEPDRCLVIDDSVQGVTGAVAAGMLAIGFIDPADPREDRAAALKAAGAMLVAEGANELSAAIEFLSSHGHRQESRTV